MKTKYSGMNLWREFFYYLFYSGLNNKPYGNSTTTAAIKSKIGIVPFLNGGLFQEAFENETGWNDSAVKVDNKAFDLIFEKLLNPYNFTVEENTPLNEEVALNPDLLGNAYEELISERHGQGAYYTHPTEVELMCRESLKTYITEHSKIDSSAITKLIYSHSSEDFTDTEAFETYKLLTNLKILDPAVGSGAYPVKMMQELVSIHQALARRIISGSLGKLLSDAQVDPENRYKFKLDIIRNNLYGTDIDHFAVEIAKLRFWLSLVVDYNAGINSPDDLNHIPALPNLDFKLRTGDSLIAKIKKGKAKDSKIGYNLDLMFNRKQIDAFFEEPIRKLSAMKSNFFNYESIKNLRHVPKEKLKKEIEELEKNLAKEIGITEIETFKGINHILWQIHFAEVFDENLNFGFDICIANPPYLRQEKIDELFKNFESGVTKEELAEAYESIYANKRIRIDRKSDLYVYFYLRAINLLKENILGYVWRRVIGIAADIQIKVFCRDLPGGHNPGITGDFVKILEGLDNLFAMLGPQEVLSATLLIIPVGIDEEEFALALGGFVALTSHHQDAGWDAGAEKEIGPQADDRLDMVLFHQFLTDLILATAPEKDAMGHDRGHDAPGPEGCQHVQGKKKIGLLFFGWEAVGGKSLRVAELLFFIRQAEGRIGENTVKSLQFATLQMLGGGEGIIIFNESPLEDTVQDKVHLANGPCRTLVVLAVKGEVIRIAAMFAHMLPGIDKHPARTAARVVDALSLLGINQADHEADHVAGSVELAPFLSGRFGKHVNQILVSRAKQVAMLEILVSHPVFAKMGNKLPQFCIRYRLFTNCAGIINLFEHTPESKIVLRKCFKCLIQGITDILVGGFINRSETCLRRHKKTFIQVVILCQLLGLLLCCAACHLLTDDPLPLLLEYVGTALEKQHAKNKIFIL